jgi:glycosyltransferase involved in cell wall biosynthesis
VGIREARGRVIAFVDGDDRWAPSFLSRQLDLMSRLDDDVGVVFCRSKVMLESGRVLGIMWQRTGRYDFDDLLVSHCPPRNGSSVLLKATVFDDAGLFDEHLSSAVDYEMWLRIASESRMPHFWGGRSYLVDTRLRRGSISSDRTARYAALDQLLHRYSKRMRRVHPGLAYVRCARRRSAAG